MGRSAVPPESRPESSGFPNALGARSNPSAICGRAAARPFSKASRSGSATKATLGEQKIAAQADTSGL